MSHRIPTLAETSARACAMLGYVAGHVPGCPQNRLGWDACSCSCVPSEVAARRFASVAGLVASVPALSRLAADANADALARARLRSLAGVVGAEQVERAMAWAKPGRFWEDAYRRLSAGETLGEGGEWRKPAPVDWGALSARLAAIAAGGSGG